MAKKSMADLQAALKDADGPAKKKSATKKKVARGKVSKRAATAAKMAVPSAVSYERYGYGEGRGTVYASPRQGAFYRKTIYFLPDEWEAVKLFGLESGDSVTQIVRAAVRDYLGVDKQGE